MKRSDDLYQVMMDMYECANAEDMHAYITQLESTRNVSWKPVGGHEGYFSTFKSQQDEPVRALVEISANAIDSLLMKNCWAMAGVDPRSEQAPQSVADAVRAFYGVHPSQWHKQEDKVRRSVAEDIQLIAQGGNKKEPNIISYDNGEGQNPEDFESTFLSIQKSNKNSVACVQGKFNMGSTGVFEFLAGRRYKLIISKRNSAIPGASEDIGFVVVRKHELTEEEVARGVRSSWYEYCVIDGEIPRFPAREMDLGLYQRTFTQGTVVKLYSYKLDLPSDITLDLWKDLNQHLYQPALPFLVFENRKNKRQQPMYKGNTPTKVVLGNKARIAKDDQKYREKTISFQLHKKGMGDVSMDVHVLKSGTPKQEFIRDKAVVFTLNGQVHAHLKRNFISQELGFPLLRDTTLIEVNCSRLHPAFIEELFMGSRDRFKRGEEYKTLIGFVTRTIKSSDELAAIEEERRKNLTQKASTKGGMLQSLLQRAAITKVLTKHMNYALNGGLKGRGATPRKKEVVPQVAVVEEVPQHTPTYFALVGKNERVITSGGRKTFTFRTDAVDHYPLTVALPENAMLSYAVEGPSSGVVKVTIECSDQAQVGDVIPVIVSMEGEREGEEITYSHELSLSVTAKKERSKKERKKRDASFPMAIKVYQEATEEGANWGEYDGFTEETVAKIITASTEKGIVMDAVAINMDARILHQYMKEKKMVDVRDIHRLRERFFSVVYLHAIALYTSLEKELEGEELEKQLDELSSTLLESMGEMILYTHHEIA